MAESGKSKGLIGAFLGMDATGKLVGILSLGLVVAVFFVGYFYGQLKQVGGGGSVGAKVADAGGAAAAPTQPTQEAPVELTDAQWESILDNPPAQIGNKNAKVVMVEFTDYQCPYCSRHFSQTEPTLDEEYVDTNKVLRVIRDLPLPFHGNAHVAAQAARCAGDQDKYWEMHDTLFGEQQAWSEEADATEVFSGFAADLGINVSTFDNCLSSEKYKQAVDDDLALAQTVGASGTPTFFINGTRLVGAQPVSAFKTLIEEQL